MKVLTHGGDDINVGNITATAVTDGTVTAQITASEGQTLMAIYGIPSGKTAYMTCYLVNAHQGATPATAAEVDFTMYINESPDIDETVSGFINKANLGIRTTGNTSPTRCYKPYLKVEGPAIIKFQGTASAEAVEGVAEFDLIIINDE